VIPSVAGRHENVKWVKVNSAKEEIEDGRAPAPRSFGLVVWIGGRRGKRENTETTAFHLCRNKCD
jgi:hypothetical protein